MKISKKIEEITDYIFQNYGNTKLSLQQNKRNLYIHDNIFGTLKFSKFERQIINSPFLQRLVKIKQMGLASLVYPGGTHKRFSHSLGVSYIAEKIYLAVADQKTREKDLQKQDINTLKLAGILHDIGHGPFSHLTENVIQRLSIFDDYPSKKLDSEIYNRAGRLGAEAKFHEYLSFHIIKDKRVKEFLEETYKDASINFDLVPLCITGNSLPNKNEKGQYSEELVNEYENFLIKIINSYSDADKIDYLMRDSQFTGLPVPADIDRLLSFFTINEFDGKYELGVLEKGARAFNLLLKSKAKLTPTIYHHHTTLACESLLEFGIVRAIRNAEVVTKNLDSEKWPHIKCGVDLLLYDDSTLLNYLRIVDDPICNYVVKRIQQRKHYRVVSQFYTWELRRLIIKNRDNFLKSIKKSNRTKLKNLKDEGKLIERKNIIDSLYAKYLGQQQKKIADLYHFQKDYETLLDFKRSVIKKVPDVLKKLKDNFPKVSEDVLIDYCISIRMSGKNDVAEAYKQPYIKRYNHFKGKFECLSLSEIGYSIPKTLDYQKIIFYSLPEYCNDIKPYIREYINQTLEIDN